jgi:ABC-type nitrate/sulfonate/bicarbonate transport system ATPase subunit
VSLRRADVELMRWCFEEKKAVVFITHSIHEAVLLRDRVDVMWPRPGRVFSVLDVAIRRPRNLKTLALHNSVSFGIGPAPCSARNPQMPGTFER